MLKKVLLFLVLLIGMSANAAVNYLNSVVIANDNGQKSIVLRSDEIAKVKKETNGSDTVILTVKGIAQSAGINTLYKNSSDVRGMIIQNEGNNDLKIYIDAPEIAKANVVFETPNSAPITVKDSINDDKIIWSLISVALLFVIMYKSTKQKPQPDINEVIKEREKALYRNFQKEVSTLPSMNYKLKGYRKHVLKGETIRSYESRMATKV